MKQISLFTGSPYNQYIKPSIQDKREKTLAASISSINPTTASAGIGTVLTINGSGFGTSYSGSANVEFKNSDDGGNTWISAIASNIVSWNDAQIQVKIPTRSGTGVVKVTAKDGTVANSSLALTINYNALNTTYNNNHYRYWLSNQDNMGGHTLTFNDAFGADPTSAVKEHCKPGDAEALLILRLLQIHQQLILFLMMELILSHLMMQHYLLAHLE